MTKKHYIILDVNGDVIAPTLPVVMTLSEALRRALASVTLSDLLRIDDELQCEIEGQHHGK